MSDDDGFNQALFDLQVTLNSFHVTLPPPPLKPMDRFIRDYEDVCKEKRIPFNKKKANDQWYELQTSLKSDYKHLFEREFYTYEKLKAMEAIINTNQKKLNSWNVFHEQEKKRYPHLKYSEYEPLLRKQWKELTPREQASFREQAPKVMPIEEKKKIYEEFELLKQEYISKSTDIPRDLEFYDKMNDVEMIIGYRKNTEGIKEYLIKWKGQSGDNATWTAKSKLRPLRTMIKYYQSTYQNPDQISYSSFSDNEEVFPLYPDADGDAKGDQTKQGKGKKSKQNKKQQDQEGKQNTQSDDDDRVEVNPVFGLFAKQPVPNVNNKKKKIKKPIKKPVENIQISSDSEDQVKEVDVKEEKGGKNKQASKEKIAPKPITKKIQKKKVETPKVIEDKKKKVQTKQVQPVKNTKPVPKVQPKQVQVIDTSDDASLSEKPAKQLVRKGRSNAKIIESSESHSTSPSASLQVIQPAKEATKVTLKRGTKQEKQIKVESKPQARNTKAKQLTPQEIVEIVKENVQKQNKKQTKEKTKQTKEGVTQTKKVVQTKKITQIKTTTRRGGAQQVQPIKKTIQKRR